MNTLTKRHVKDYKGEHGMQYGMKATAIHYNENAEQDWTAAVGLAVSTSGEVYLDNMLGESKIDEVEMPMSLEHWWTYATKKLTEAIADPQLVPEWTLLDKD